MFKNREEAKVHREDRFDFVAWEETHRGRCYSEWWEIWATKDGSPVTDTDVKAFKMLPQGQGHDVVILPEKNRIRLDCVLDSGD